MLPEHRYNLIVAYGSRNESTRKIIENYTRIHDNLEPDEFEPENASCTGALEWNSHLTTEGIERLPFGLHLESAIGHNHPVIHDQEPDLVGHGHDIHLPNELQLRVLDFCSDRMTLFQLMRVSSLFRTEASKRFWADPHTYYSVDVAWILAGGYPGHTSHSMSSLSLVQNIELDFGVDAEGLIAPRGLAGIAEMQHELLEGFWNTFQERFPSIQRVVVNQSSTREATGISEYINRFVKACPSHIDITLYICQSYGHPRFRRGRLYGRREWRFAKSLCRLFDDGRLEEVATRLHYQTVLIPMRKFKGPVGEYEKAQYVDQRIELQRRGLGATMVEALSRHHFDEGGPGPFDCPMRYCHEHFTKSGQWLVHAALEHVNDLVPGRQFEGWPEHLRSIFRRRQIELFRLKEKNALAMKRIHQEWDDATDDKRHEIKEAWMEQLKHDPDWDTGVPAEESPLWKRFKSRMQQW